MTLELKDIWLSYGGKAVFSGLNLTIPADGAVCVTGPSGSGKTSLLSILAGLVKPDSGIVSGLPETVGIMFQDDRLLPWLNALENITAVTTAENAMRLLEAVELKGEAGSHLSELSGGMRRRVALARALAFDCDLLLLDEPFKGLDQDLTVRMSQLILRSAPNVIAASHSPFEAQALGSSVISL